MKNISKKELSQSSVILRITTKELKNEKMRRVVKVRSYLTIREQDIN